MDRVAIYLRKSRADLEAETRGEGETLAKHKKALLQVAKNQSLHIIKIRQEIVSGESLIHRPEMMELLRDVENGLYNAVLVMDVDRLGRGNMREQGLILETFQKANTKIITPRKTYDLRDEWDEEYSEFEAFMARKELKIINRRLQGGRVRSVEEGNYIGTRPPYGYEIRDDNRSRYLVPKPEQAPVVKMIFNWYTHDDPNQRLGSNKIANELNTLGYRTYLGNSWNSSSVLNIIKNAVYAGRIQWKKKEHRKTADPLKRREVKTRAQSDWIDVQGKHEPLISMETYQKAQQILKKQYHVPYQLENGISNPLAGLIKCAKCGSSMVLRPYTNQLPHLMCYKKQCKNKSSRFMYVEDRLIEVLHTWLDQYRLTWDKKARPETFSYNIELKETTLRNLQQETRNLENQKGRLHDLLERGIYDEETYLNRSQHIANRISEIHQALDKTRIDLDEEQNRVKVQMDIIPKVEHALDIYPLLQDAKQKNALLKVILDHCTYDKEKHQWNNDFTITVYPKL